MAGSFPRWAIPAAVVGVVIVGAVAGWVAFVTFSEPHVTIIPKTAMTTLKAKLEPATFAQLPGWRDDDHLAAFKTFVRSCDRVIALAAKAGPKSRKAALAEVCKAAKELEKPTRVSAKEYFETHFVPHRVLQKDAHGLLTGYYEPVLNGSRDAQGSFQVPIYKRPADLVNVVDETERAASKGLTHVRKTKKGSEPYFTRAEIEQGALKGQGLELLYLDDPVEAFFLHVQGSGRIKLTDGTSVRINYDGKNGYPYTSIGRYLTENGLFPAHKMSMQAMGRWLRTDPERGREVMWQNASFIFFRELKGGDAEGPQGALGVALTPGRSLAVDTAYHELGTPVYVAAPKLKHATASGGYRRLMIAQDVGSAIKGPERGDIYFGSGDRAGKLAGITKHPGNFYVLLPAPWPKTRKAAG